MTRVTLSLAALMFGAIAVPGAAEAQDFVADRIPTAVEAQTGARSAADVRQRFAERARDRAQRRVEIRKRITDRLAKQRELRTRMVKQRELRSKKVRLDRLERLRSRKPHRQRVSPDFRISREQWHRNPEIFDQLDRDKNGALTREELRRRPLKRRNWI